MIGFHLALITVCTGLPHIIIFLSFIYFDAVILAIYITNNFLIISIQIILCCLEMNYVNSRVFSEAESQTIIQDN